MKYSDSRMPQSTPSSTIQPPTPYLAEIPGTPARAASPAKVNQHSMIGKSIVIKGEIACSDPLYIEGCVEGLINAPENRVTIGREGKVKADISAREVVIMGDVCGNLIGGDRVEIRSAGSLRGDLTAPRICIEDGAFLKGAVDVLQISKADSAGGQKEPHSELEPEEAASTAEPDLDPRSWASVASPELD
jgi:cytoskeletal protein CcmA (bactofilin family)